MQKCEKGTDQISLFVESQLTLSEWPEVIPCGPTNHDDGNKNDILIGNYLKLLSIA